ncbi:MAG: hypothetical protein JSW61_11145 [Candidatus Thorarchaeota archaeon]|nr:MAG: hypothetical protein JSW61_11145 [Candidatus Thorarchaeota archaeon]
MTYAFCVFYRLRLLTQEEKDKARETWDTFSSQEWPEDLTLVGDYSYAWGTEWNGFLLIETPNPESFFSFWPKFRDRNRWYVENTRTIIGKKRE